MFVSAQKSFLCEIVGQSEIGPRELPQHSTHGRLMPTNQLAKRVLVVVNKDSSEQVRIC